MIHRVLETEYGAVSVYDLVRHAAVDGVDGLTWEDGNAIRVVAGLVDELVRFPAFALRRARGSSFRTSPGSPRSLSRFGWCRG